MATLGVLISSLINALIIGWLARRLLGTPVGWPRTLALSLIVNAATAPLLTWALPQLGVGPVLEWSPEAGAAVLVITLFGAWMIAIEVGLLAIGEAIVPTGSLPGPVELVRSLPQRWRRGRRYAAIVRILVRRGLRRYLRPGVRTAGDDARTARALRDALADGGVTFVKLGQMLATRPDLLPAAYIRELSTLHSDVPAEPAAGVRAVIEQELGASPDELFAAFDDDPLAAASVGQVHRARLNSGEAVVVKVQRPAARATVTADLDIVNRLAALAERRTGWGRALGTVDLAAGFARSLDEELDYRVELRNLVACGSGPIVVPQAHPAFSSARVLTMDALDGVPLSRAANELDALDPATRRGLAEELLLAVLRQLLVTGIFHADLHGGNVMLLREGRLALLDFGSVGRIDATARTSLALLLLALDRQDGAAATSALCDLLIAPPGLDERALEREVAELIMRLGGGLPLNDTIVDLFEVVVRHGLRVPGQIAAAFRALGAVEGTLRLLDPQLDLVALARELTPKLTSDGLAIPTADDLKDLLAANLPALQRLPRRLVGIAERLEAGTLAVRVQGLGEAGERRFLTGMMHQLVLVVLAATAAACGVALTLSELGPQLTPVLRVSTFGGLTLLLFAFVLGCRALVLVFRGREP